MTDQIPSLGRLERVPLRSVFKREDTVFTPWLAMPENLQLIAEAIGVPSLELIQTERQVSEFSLDIIARIPDTGEIVAIENQIEASDHRHLGQSIVYAAGTEAKVLVWIAERFSEGHRAALDWLNRTTTDEVAFFGIEIEAWRIGNSAPAPKLNVIVRPNEFVRQVRRQTHDGIPTVEGDANHRYWEAYVAALSQRGLGLSSKPTRSRNCYAFLAGGKEVAAVAYLARSTKRVGVYLGFYTASGPDWINYLEPHRKEIERALGVAYQTNVRSDTSAWLTAFDLDANVDEEGDWARQHAYLADSTSRMITVFEPYLASAGVFAKSDA